jgi:hypothetical protein
MLLELSAILGAAGGLVQRWMETKEKARQEAAQLEVLRERNKHELAVMESEARTAASVADMKLRGEIEQAAAKSLTDSYGNDRAAYADATKVGTIGSFLLVLVDVVRGLTRPGIAWSGLIMLWELSRTLPTGELRDSVVEALAYIATTAALWWFAARVPSGMTFKKKP